MCHVYTFFFLCFVVLFWFCIYYFHFLGVVVFFFSRRRRHTIGALVTGVPTCALPSAVASQMESARLERTVVDIASTDGAIGLRATGSVLQFPGFLALYQEGRDDTADDDEDRRLPSLKPGAALDTGD